MNADDVMNQMMNNHQKTAKRSKKTRQPKPLTKRIPEPTEPLDPENEKIKPTLIKICGYLEWMKQEIKEIREDLDAKTELVEHNTLSLKVDQIDGVVSDLAFRLEDLE